MGGRSDPTGLNQDGIFWPRDLLPERVNNIRILTYGYDSDPIRIWSSVDRVSIVQHARDLLIALCGERRSNVSYNS
jgi:hypothetical protein